MRPQGWAVPLSRDPVWWKRRAVRGRRHAVPSGSLTLASPFLKLRMPSPSPFPSSGSFLGPKTNRATTRITSKWTGWSNPSPIDTSYRLNKPGVGVETLSRCRILIRRLLDELGIGLAHSTQDLSIVRRPSTFHLTSERLLLYIQPYG